MTQQMFVRSLGPVAPARDVPACVMLEGDAQVTPPDIDGLVACVIAGSCIAQRLVAGHWIDQATFVNGGVLIASGGAPLRILWQSTPQALALLLAADIAATHFRPVARAMPSGSVLKMPADPMLTSLAKVVAISGLDAADTRLQENVVEVMVARLGQISHERLHAAQPRSGVLPSWRFRRVVTLVRERIGEEVSLANMAAAAGLSPMHFAAQFKATVGVTPHQYVLLQRIEEAKVQLGGSRASILDIALSVGFQTQAHFATVFKRLEQTTPSQWRRTQLAA